MESSISGFKQKGTWEDVVEHGEKIVSVLETVDKQTEYDVDSSLIEEFNEWRPKVKELGSEEEISDKTAEKASVSENKSEKENKGVADDIGEAASEASKSVDALSETNIEDSWEYWKSTTAYMTRATDTFWRKNFRRIEKFVYKHLMTIVSPYYFDNLLVSANIQRTAEDTFVFEVNINDDRLKNKIESILYELDDRERWHLDHDHIDGHTNTVEAEGAEPIEDTPSMDSKEVRDSIQDDFKD